MKKSELKMCFKDLRDRMDNVSTDPDVQRLDYQIIAVNALTVIKQVIDTGMEEDKDQLLKIYSNAYEQGRFDEYADRMGHDQAEKVKAKIDKQKNCPYCHRGKPLIDAVHHEYRQEFVKSFKQAVHIEGDRLFVEEETTDTRQINYCPMCGRSLKEETLK